MKKSLAHYSTIAILKIWGACQSIVKTEPQYTSHPAKKAKRRGWKNGSDVPWDEIEIMPLTNKPADIDKEKDWKPRGYPADRDYPCKRHYEP